MASHLLLLAGFAFFVSLIFAVLAKDVRAINCGSAGCFSPGSSGQPSLSAG